MNHGTLLTAFTVSGTTLRGGECRKLVGLIRRQWQTVSEFELTAESQLGAPPALLPRLRIPADERTADQ